MLISPSGGTPREIQTKHNIGGRAVWLPDGKRLLFPSTGGDAGNDWYTVTIDGAREEPAGAAAYLKDSGLNFVWARPFSVGPEGVLIFSGSMISSNIYRVPFDFAAGRVTGPPVPITMAPNMNYWPSSSSDGKSIAFGSAPRINSNLWQIPLDSAGVASGEPRRITDGLEEHVGPLPYAGGSHVVYLAKTGMFTEIRLRNIATGEETRISETSGATPPIISEDGSQIAYAVMEQKQLAIYAITSQGGVAKRLCENCGRPIQWVNGGKHLLYDRSGKDQREIAILDVTTGAGKVILRHPEHRLFTPRVSPDGKLLAFTTVTGPLERRTHVVPFTPDRMIDPREWRVLVNGSYLERQPFWSPKGGLIYFLSARDGFQCVWGQRVDPAAMKSVGEPFAVRHFHAFRYSLLDFDDPAEIGLSVAGNHMFLAVRDLHSNIWLAERVDDRKK
jgi:Tol biopolymer transport system component